MKDRLEFILFISLSYLVRLFGLNISIKLSVLLAYLFFYLIPIRKETTIQNLSNAFPEKSSAEVKKIALNSYKSFCITLVEILIMPSFSREKIISLVDCPDKEMIIQKYNEGKGVILLSGHFGNWEYIAASVSAQINIPFSVVVKSQRNPFVTEWMNKARTNWINKVVPLGISIRQIFKELKEKNIVAMVADQRGPADGIRVNFFGRQVSVYPGPAILALKTGAPLIYGITIRQPDYSYHAILKEISAENLPANDEEKVIELSRRHTAFLEEIIRKHPEQWLWMHKRWKY